jgi:hypothetical protein
MGIIYLTLAIISGVLGFLVLAVRVAPVTAVKSNGYGIYFLVNPALPFCSSNIRGTPKLDKMHHLMTLLLEAL